MAFPDNPRVTGLRRDPRMGELAGARASASLYRGLRPEALAIALYIGAQTRALSGDGAADRHLDRARRGLPAPARGPQPRGDPQLLAAHHRLGLRRRPPLPSKRQALAFQFVLDRLQTLDAIAWVREPGAIHVTAAPEGKALLPLLERVQPSG